MKNILSVLSLGLIFHLNVSGQCTPNPQYANAPFGFYPDSITFLTNSSAFGGFSYDEKLELKTFTDSLVAVSGFSINFLVDGFRILDVIGAPAGFSFTGGGNTFETADPRPDFSQFSVDSTWWNVYGTPNDPTTLQPVQGCIQITASAGAVSAAAPASGFVDYPIEILLDARIAATEPDVSGFLFPNGSWFSETSGILTPITVLKYVLRVNTGCTPTTSTTNISSCSAITWNGTTYGQSGTYTYTTTNSQGCDSVATLNLTVNPLTSSTNVSTCGSYDWNNATYSQSGTYTFQTTNAAGCDSIATLNLTIEPTAFVNESYTLCGDETVTVNGVTYGTEGQFTQQLSGSGCDTVLTVNVSAVPEPNITILGNTGISPNTSESYAVVQQPGYSITWSATNGTIIEGQGTPSATIFWDQTGMGEIVLELSNGTCTFTYVQQVGSIGIDEMAEHGYRLYPNPGNGQFTLSYPALNGELSATVYDNLGRQVFTDAFVVNGSGKWLFDLEGMDTGAYMVILTTPEGRYSQKLLVQ